MNYFIKKYNNSVNDSISEINLPSSKSESNRLLIMNALSGEKLQLSNLSSARDTQTMIKLLKDKSKLSTFDVLDAGTAMRFLTAYLATSTDKEVTITGTQRMQERPIKILVDALQSIGCSITYKYKSGYPPLEISPLNHQIKSSLQIPGNISSQYISALLMIAPTLEKGLKITIQKPIYSQPYIDMTLGLMKLAGIQIQKNDNVIEIRPQNYHAETSIAAEADWSAASYWYSIIALSPVGKKVTLLGLNSESFQGDHTIQKLMKNFGVATSFNSSGITLEKKQVMTKPNYDIDFKECPDLAQTVLPCAAALGISLNLTGLESLKIKETDRVKALQNELSKFNVKLEEKNNHEWTLLSNNFSVAQEPTINTYDDHRMAMGFAPLALKTAITIENTDVVNKSYPTFWEDLEIFGFEFRN